MRRKHFLLHTKMVGVLGLETWALSSSADGLNVGHNIVTKIWKWPQVQHTNYFCILWQIWAITHKHQSHSLLPLGYFWVPYSWCFAKWISHHGPWNVRRKCCTCPNWTAVNLVDMAVSWWQWCYRTWMAVEGRRSHLKSERQSWQERCA